MNQIDSVRDDDEILTALDTPAPVKYSEFGGRQRSPEEFLAWIRPLLPKLGITRVADISYLSPYAHPVFQCTRPSLFSHTIFGQNTGGQGKGPSRAAAEAAAIMETVESYSAEPRNVSLIRNSFDNLRGLHVMLSPRDYEAAAEIRRPPREDEPLMWTHAVSLEHRAQVLVPAELVYFPFFPAEYDTRGVYPCSSNGLAGGGSYLEAVLHGLYEVIERHYSGSWQRGRVEVELLFEDEVDSEAMRMLRRELPEYEVQLDLLRLPGVRDLPMVRCYLVPTDGDVYEGSACNLDLDTAIAKAVGEALQSMVTRYSGSREDMDSHVAVAIRYHQLLKRAFSRRPRFRTVHLDDLRAEMPPRRWETLNDELEALLAWIHRAGFGNVFVSNLTRVGVDVPVVKVLVPGMTPLLASASAGTWTSRSVNAAKYSFSTRKRQ